MSREQAIQVILVALLVQTVFSKRDLAQSPSFTGNTNGTQLTVVPIGVPAQATAALPSEPNGLQTTDEPYGNYKEPSEAASVFSSKGIPLFGKVVDQITGGFTSQIGATVFNKIFGLGPPTLKQIEESVSNIVDQALQEEAIAEADSHVDKVFYWYSKEYPSLHGDPVEKDRELSYYPGDLNFALQVFQRSDLNKETTLPAYMVTTGYLLAILQERVNVRGHARILVTDVAHANAQTANNILWKLHAKRQQAFRISTYRKYYQHIRRRWYEYYELKDTWKGSKWRLLVEPTNCWPRPKNYNDCPEVKQEIDTKMLSIMTNWKQEVAFDPANTLIAKWAASQ